MLRSQKCRLSLGSLTASAPRRQTRIAICDIYSMLSGAARMLCRCACGGIKHPVRVLLHASRLPARGRRLLPDLCAQGSEMAWFNAGGCLEVLQASQSRRL